MTTVLFIAFVLFLINAVHSGCLAAFMDTERKDNYATAEIWRCGLSVAAMIMCLAAGINSLPDMRTNCDTEVSGR